MRTQRLELIQDRAARAFAEADHGDECAHTNGQAEQSQHAATGVPAQRLERHAK
jgi:hypothetical protein